MGNELHALALQTDIPSEKRNHNHDLRRTKSADILMRSRIFLGILEHHGCT